MYEWRNVICVLMEYHSALKGAKILSHAAGWMNHEGIMPVTK